MSSHGYSNRYQPHDYNTSTNHDSLRPEYDTRYSSIQGSSSKKRPKYIEVMKERPVITKKYVDVPEEVVIERPVENRI